MKNFQTGFQDGVTLYNLLICLSPNSEGLAKKLQKNPKVCFEFYILLLLIL